MQPPSTAPKSSPAYFVESKKGEVNELRQHLSSLYMTKDNKKKRDVIKKVIAYMTLGIDVSRLYSEMVKISKTTDPVIKKMVYLYLCSYAATHPDLTLLAINTLQSDCQDDDPMVRGLALRSLCSLRLESILEYVMRPLETSLRDQSAYVRRTGVLGILKVYHLSPSTIKESGLIDVLYNMIRDKDPQVVSNCIVVLNEIMANEGGIAINQPIIHHLLNRIKDFNEWGQIVVLGLVSKYTPTEQDETFAIMNLLDAVLRVSNSAVVLATIKCFLHLTESMPKIHRQVYERLRTPLLTLMAAAPNEIVFTVLSHIAPMVQRCRGLFDNDFKLFFCKYNDPTYIKDLKMKILPELANENNAAEILSELSEFVSGISPDVARQAIQAIGKIAVHMEPATDRVIAVLLELLDLDIEHVMSETLVVMRDLLRAYPAKAPSVISSLQKCFRNIEDPEGKSALIWMMGEYGQLIDEAPYLLEPLIDSITQESDARVRAELLTATTKLFFKRPPEVQQMLGRLFKICLDDSNDPLVHDKALLYWRLLRTNVREAAAVICGQPQPVSTFLEDEQNSEKEKIFREFNSLSIVYGKPEEKFVDEEHRFVVREVEAPAEEPVEALGGLGSYKAESPAPAPAANGGGGGLGGFASSPAPAPAPAPAASGAEEGDLLGDLFGSAPSPSSSAASPAAPSLKPAPDALAPPAFQSKWQSLAERPVPPVQTTHCPSLRDLEPVLKSKGIMVLAHAEDATAMKLYCYGQLPSNAYLLMFLQWNKSSHSITVTAKPEGDVGNIEGIVRSALQQYL